MGDKMKLKVKFGKETRFVVPYRRILRPEKQLLSGPQKSIRLPAMAGQPKPGKRPDE
jgi:hypothetical protein